MNDQEDEDEQTERRFDRLVKRLLTRPPKSRADLAEEARLLGLPTSAPA
jgi:hypothetical protein